MHASGQVLKRMLLRGRLREAIKAFSFRTVEACLSEAGIQTKRSKESLPRPRVLMTTRTCGPCDPHGERALAGRSTLQSET